jgi:hypothetical protein
LSAGGIHNLKETSGQLKRLVVEMRGNDQGETETVYLQTSAHVTEFLLSVSSLAPGQDHAPILSERRDDRERAKNFFALLVNEVIANERLR